MLPNDGEKYDAEALFTPEEALRAQGEGVPEVPPAVLLGYQPRLTEAVRGRAGDPVELVRSQRCLPLSERVGYVPVHESGVGAPVTATVTENVVAAGAERVVMLGGCAALQPEVPADGAILPTGSIRDEGVSYHYVPAEEPVEPSPSLVGTLREALTDAGFETHSGPTWTTSAMYRETVPEIEQYREDGVVSLCMESAALWAVCQYRGVEAATVHEVGDYLAPDEWTPDSEPDVLVDLLDPTVRALARAD